MQVRFSKYEGLGNDFVLFDESADLGQVGLAAVARALCDRHRGVGADGVLVVGKGARPSMRIVNADGSEPEMCGNGLRCAALHLVRVGGVAARRFTVDTAAGPHACDVGEHGQVEVTMRAPSFVPTSLPMQTTLARVVGEPFEIAGKTVHLTAVSMGNPHVVTFDAIDDATRRELGPAIFSSPLFPNGVNVGFARISEANTIVLSVFERGVGWTQACATGACAAAAAADALGLLSRREPIPVTLPGGTVFVTLAAPGEAISMRGPARHVFDGVLELEGVS